MPPPNPFVYGNPVQGERFVGRDQPLQQVLDRLSNRARESTSVVAADRMGRTSFLRRLTHPAMLAERLELGQFIPIHLDGKSAAGLDDQAIWGRILQLAQRAYGEGTVKGQFEAAANRAGQGQLAPFELEDLFDALAAQGRLLLLAVDDFQFLLSNQQLRPPAPFFDGLRSLLVREPRGLAMVVASPRPLLDMWRLGPGGSPFYNIFGTVILQRFTAEEVNTLLDHHLAGTGIEFTADERQLIQQVSGRHPMLVQYAAHVLYDARLNGVADRRQAVETAIRDEVGPAVQLQRQLLQSYRNDEREAVETWVRSPNDLTAAQRAVLSMLNGLGALPPGMEIE